MYTCSRLLNNPQQQQQQKPITVEPLSSGPSTYTIQNTSLLNFKERLVALVLMQF